MLSIVIPAHNEARRILPLLRGLRDRFASAELIVVANACADDTASIVAEQATHDSDLRLIDVGERLGKGGAVRLGFHVARGDVVAFVDADGSTPPEELERLHSHLGGSDCIIASRWVRGARVLVPQTPLRRMLGRAFNLMVRALFGMTYADTQCGAKIFKRSALEEIIEDVETADFAFDVDLLYQLSRRGRVVREVPTVWLDRAGSTVNAIATGPKMLASILRLRLSHSPCRYIIPLFDSVFGNRAIKCRRRVRLLVLAGDISRADRAATTSKLQAVLKAYCGDRREVTWWAPSRKTLVAIEYLRHYRTRYDCIVEVATNGRRFFTPFFTLKPIIMVAPRPLGARWPYAHVEHLEDIADELEFELAVRRALARSNAYFLQEADGTWTFQPRREAPPTRAAAAQHRQIRQPAPSAAVVGSPQ